MSRKLLNGAASPANWARKMAGPLMVFMGLLRIWLRPGSSLDGAGGEHGDDLLLRYHEEDHRGKQGQRDEGEDIRPVSRVLGGEIGDRQRPGIGRRRVQHGQ